MDLTRLPVGEAIIGFLVSALVVTFVIAFTFVDTGGSSEETPNGDDGGDPTPVTGGVDIAMFDNAFEPTDFIVAAGDTIDFNITNEGGAIHNMHIASPDGEYAVSGVCEVGGEEPCSDPDTVAPGTTAVLTWEIPADASGAQIPFRCDFHPVEMTGTLTVQ